MARRPAIMLYKGDWKRDPQLSMCSPATRGIWIDLLCDMDDLASATIQGTAAMLARMCRASAAELTNALKELRTSGAADVSEEDGIFTVSSRRIARDLMISEVRSNAVQSRYKTSTNETSKATQNAESESEDEIAFGVGSKKSCNAEAIYSAYPRKVGKAAAVKAINAAFQRLCRGENPQLAVDHAEDFLLEAATAFAKSPAGNKGTYTPHPATWFGAGRYLDDPREWFRTTESKPVRRQDPGVFSGDIEGPYTG